jgi:protein SCO1/2
VRRLLAVALLALIATLSACGSASSESAPFSGIDHAPYAVGHTTLTDTSSRPYTLATDATKPLTLVFFGYTHCPDLCPLVMNSLAAAMQRLDDTDRSATDVVFVTTDPGRDTADVLRRYLDRYDPSFVGLTGRLDDIVRLGESMKIYVGSGQKLPTGGYDLSTHDTHVSAVVPGGRATVLWDMNTSPKQFADDIHSLLQKARA